MKEMVKNILKKIMPYRLKSGIKKYILQRKIKKNYFQARNWVDFYSEEQTDFFASDTSSCDGSNPLRRYFDAHTEGKGIHKWLHYFEIYHRYFNRFIGKEVHVVEVGVAGGGSLDMWKSYFGGGCKVYGVDIHKECKKFEDDATKIFVGDQGNRDFWKAFKAKVPAVDVFIDDGSHKPEDQIVTIEEMLPHIKPGGVYLCEDIHGVYNPFTAYICGFIDKLNGMKFRLPGHYFEVVPSAMQKYVYAIHSYPFVTVIEKAGIPLNTISTQIKGTQGPPY
jgi:hypothetical protein